MGFKTGDDVRLLHSTDAGKIVKIIDNRTAEVEIEDGFVIPVLLRELVPVSEEEKTEFNTEPTTETEPAINPPTKEPAIEHILFALEEAEPGIIHVFLINNTDYSLLYVITGTDNGVHYEVYKGIAKARAYALLGTATRKNLDKYQKITFQLILSAPHCREIPLPIRAERRWDLRQLLKKKQPTPLLDRQTSYLDIGPGRINVNPKLLKERMMEGHPGPASNATGSVHGPEEIVVDLHIENIVKDTSSLTSSEILEIQIRTFEKALDHALLSGAKRIKFIHGLGNGTLRHTIHKKLSKSALIKYFEDVEKSKFGYGATMIHFK